MNLLDVRDIGNSQVLLEVDTTQPCIKIKCISTDRYGIGSGVHDVVVDTTRPFIYFEQSETYPCRIWYFDENSQWPIVHFDVDNYKQKIITFFLAQAICI